MNIEILFRGKRTDNGEWVEGDLRQDNDLETKYISGWNYYTNEDGLQREPFEYEIDSKTVCQYTGLTDKNGRKIFEGDILKRVLLPTKRIENSFRIAFTPVKSCFSAIDLDGSNVTFISDYINSSYEIEVIGNIFDNPELLEGSRMKDIAYMNHCNIINAICPYEHSCSMCRLHSDYETAKQKSERLSQS